MDNRPIGIFDSGVGGLSVWKEITRTLPQESVIYYADSANCPYGPRPPQEAARLSDNITRFLIARGCKLIVVACNTATAAAIEPLRKSHPVPFVGMEPAVKPAAQSSRTGHIGVLATEGTFNGRLFRETSQRYTQGLSVHVQVGYGLVEIVEQGRQDTPETAALLQKYLTPMLESGVDQLVLGCTHYPFLAEPIKKITQGKMRLHDPAGAVAEQTGRQLDQQDLRAEKAHSPSYTLYTSGDPAAARHLMGKITEKPIEVISR